jgi:hypothetical protein
MSIGMQTFSICPSDSRRQPFRRTLIQSHSAKERVQTVIRLCGFCVLKITLKTFVVRSQDAHFMPGCFQVGFKLLDLTKENRTVRRLLLSGPGLEVRLDTPPCRRRSLLLMMVDFGPGQEPGSTQHSQSLTRGLRARQTEWASTS